MRCFFFFSLEEKKNDKNVNVIECSKHSVFFRFFFFVLSAFSFLLTFSFFLLLIRSFFLSSMIAIVFFFLFYHYYSCFYTGEVLSFAVVVVFRAESRTLLHGGGVHPGLRVPGASQYI